MMAKKDINSYVILRQAELFYISAKALHSQALQYCGSKNKEKNKQSVSSYTSSIVLFALSIEIGLKALLQLEGKKIRRIHNLKKLYDCLSPDTKNLIDKNLREERFKVNLIEYLERNGDSFETWRYIYENGGAASTDFLEAFSEAIIKAGQNFDSE